MNVSFSQKDRVLIVRLEGELDQHTTADVRAKLEAALYRGAHYLLFDFTKLKFMDSSGIGLILGRYKELNLIGGKIAFFGADKAVERLLKISGLLRIGALYPTERKALSALCKGGDARG